MARPGDFGRDFLGRVLPACLFQSVDYVQALRVCARMLHDFVEAVFGRCDVMHTPMLTMPLQTRAATVRPRG